MPLDIQIGDIVRTRKPHACGGDRWRVYRVGADIGLRCLNCDRRVMLPRRKFERAVKSVLRGGDMAGGGHGGGL
ncbi:MAG: DUF951 domain-containing protein [Anaerolineae bacterium]|nr:DUF951 domain-containing protein [Anaerolineae bacterium]